MNTQTTTPMSMTEVLTLRQRILKGEEVSRDELRRALEGLRQDRTTAAARASTKKSAKAPPKPLDLTTLFAKPGIAPEESSPTSPSASQPPANASPPKVDFAQLFGKKG